MIFWILIITQQEDSFSKPVKLSKRKAPRNADYIESQCANGGTNIMEQPKRITISLSMGEECVVSDVVSSTTGNDDLIQNTGDRSEKLLSDIKDMLLSVQKDREEKKDVATNRTEWQLVALVLDRAFLIVFVVLTVVVSLCILLNHPTYEPSDWPIHWKY